ncbi:Nre family DNA repair protein [uncultured Methanospirillum sp.]|uniref:Nre family DNA repair protein n=1 Tax=uncultured Methanospirillum sp. TaxID=262503 RepID=UPI0029C6E6B1|nr:Nre family DNA repair protein [uncultured Methanospirillum sp.]
MSIGKGEYLRTLTAATVHMKSVPVGTDLVGSSPPSVFIGSSNYPKVYAGPMIAPMHGDTSVMDRPEEWIPGNIPQDEIIRYRLSLVRGMHQVKATEIDDRFIGKLQEIALSDNSIESEATFSTAPAGFSFSEEHTPYGPSAPIKRLEIEEQRWNRDLEKVYYDTDLKAADAVVGLHHSNTPFSHIQKAFSVGVMGNRRGRRLVPTRWSITACDTIIGNHLLKEVKKCSAIDTWKVHEFSSLNNRYAVILMPTPWQYEWTEAFVRVLGNEELVFSDHELHKPKTQYSHLGGCYYSCKMAVLEALAEQQRQAGAIILREASSGYVPLGVFNVRENVRNAMKQKPREFEDEKQVKDYLSDTFTLPLRRFEEAGTLFHNLGRKRQTTLGEF